MPYAVVALTHTLPLLKTRRSSGCWYTPEELLVLAQTSKTNTKELTNTSVGVKRLSTMALRARIRIVQGGTRETEIAKNEGQEAVQLVIDVTNSDPWMGRVEPKEEYGKLD